MPKAKYTDAEILSNIKAGRQEVLTYMFEQNYASIRKYIIQNSGTLDDVDDALQEAVVIVWQNVLKPEFQLTSQLNTYLYAIVKNLWYKQLKRKSRNVQIKDNEFDYLSSTGSKENTIDKKIILSCIDEIGETCKNLLSYYYFDGYNMTQIGEMMGFNNSDTVKAKKYQCLKKLQEIVKSRYSKSDFGYDM